MLQLDCIANSKTASLHMLFSRYDGGEQRAPACFCRQICRRRRPGLIDELPVRGHCSKCRGCCRSIGRVCTWGRKDTTGELIFLGEIGFHCALLEGGFLASRTAAGHAMPLHRNTVACVATILSWSFVHTRCTPVFRRTFRAASHHQAWCLPANNPGYAWALQRICQRCRKSP